MNNLSFSSIQKTIDYIFPREFTFWSVLYYIFLFYLVAFIVFNIYIWANDLEYEIDCEHHDKCFIITEKGQKNKADTEKSNN